MFVIFILPTLFSFDHFRASSGVLQKYRGFFLQKYRDNIGEFEKI